MARSINQQTIDGFMAALRAGNNEEIANLLAKHPGLASSPDGAGVSLLLQTCYFRQFEALEMLLCVRAELDVFEAASLAGGIARLASLLDDDPSLVSAWSADGFTPLHLAAYFGGEKAARLLVEKGADVNSISRNPMKLTPLHSAAVSRSQGIVEMLIEHDAAVNAKQSGGWTPLHAAAHNGDQAMIEYLIQHGADPALKSDDGKTPAEIAQAGGHQAVAHLLRKAIA